MPFKILYLSLPLREQALSPTLFAMLRHPLGNLSPLQNPLQFFSKDSFRLPS